MKGGSIGRIEFITSGGVDNGVGSGVGYAITPVGSGPIGAADPCRAIGDGASDAEHCTGQREQSGFKGGGWRYHDLRGVELLLEGLFDDEELVSGEARASDFKEIGADSVWHRVSIRCGGDLRDGLPVEVQSESSFGSVEGFVCE